MNTDKSFVKNENSILGSRAISIAMSSRPKFEHVERLNTIVNEIEQMNNKPAQPQQIVEMIKNKIKSNYNNLYENYEPNKSLIQKNIHETEAHDANESSAKFKYDVILIEDKLKADIESRQSELYKLCKIRDKVKSLSIIHNKELKESLDQKLLKIKLLENERNVLEYEAAVLAEMKSQKNVVKLTLKERQEAILEEQITKNERTKAMKETAHTKKVLIGRIDERINEEDICEIPDALNEELESALEEYQEIYSHENILIHEQKLNEEKAELERELYEKEQEFNQKIRLTKEKEDKREHDAAKNNWLLKKSEEDRIKRLFGVSELSEITKENLEEETKKLENAKKQVENEIHSLTLENEDIKTDIEKMLTTFSESKEKNQNLNLLELERSLEDEDAQLRKIKNHFIKKEALVTEWQACLQVMFGESCNRANMLEKLRVSASRYEAFNEKEKTTKINAIESDEKSRFIVGSLHEE